MPLPLHQILEVFSFHLNSRADLFRVHKLITNREMRKQDLVLYEYCFNGLKK